MVVTIQVRLKIFIRDLNVTIKAKAPALARSLRLHRLAPHSFQLLPNSQAIVSRLLDT